MERGPVQPFDPAVLERLRDSVGEEEFVDLARAFAHDAQRLEDVMLAAAEARDLDGTRRTAHELRGAAALFGADELAKRCADIERLDAMTGILKKVEIAVEMCGTVRESILDAATQAQTGAA